MNYSLGNQRKCSNNVKDSGEQILLQLILIEIEWVLPSATPHPPTTFFAYKQTDWSENRSFSPEVKIRSIVVGLCNYSYFRSVLQIIPCNKNTVVAWDLRKLWKHEQPSNEVTPEVVQLYLEEKTKANSSIITRTKHPSQFTHSLQVQVAATTPAVVLTAGFLRGGGISTLHVRSR